MLNEQFTYLARTVIGNQVLIRVLNSSRDLELFIYVGTLSHRFEPIEDLISIPYRSLHGMLRQHLY